MPSVKRPLEIRVPSISPWLIRAVILSVLGLWALLTSFYTVPAESVGVLQRFGRALRETSPPGLHFKAPFGVDTVTVVPVLRQLKLEFGYSTPGGTNPEQAGMQPNQERSMVTGDLNAALVDWVVQYRVENPHNYLFRVKNADRTLRDLSEAVMREVIGDRTVDEVITVGRQEIEGEALKKLKALVADYELGLFIDQVQLKDVDPPVPVQESFDEVNKAQQDRENLINVATGEYNRVIPKARGEADQKIRGAEGYKVKRINEAQGDVAAFTAQFDQYRKAPDVTRARLYLEAMEEVLPAAGPKIIVDDSVKQIFPFLPSATATGLPNARPTAPAAPARR